MGHYVGDGVSDSPWTSAFGVAAGAGVHFRANGRGPGAELRYRHFTRTIGQLRGSVAPSFTWTF